MSLCLVVSGASLIWAILFLATNLLLHGGHFLHVAFLTLYPSITNITVAVANKFTGFPDGGSGDSESRYVNICISSDGTLSVSRGSPIQF